jgi:hypothetical protein
MQIEIDICQRVGRRIPWKAGGISFDDPLKLEYKKDGIAVSVDGWSLHKLVRQSHWVRICFLLLPKLGELKESL